MVVKARAIKFFKVTVLPAKLEPDGLYLLKTGPDKFKIVAGDAKGNQVDSESSLPTSTRAFAMMVADE